MTQIDDCGAELEMVMEVESGRDDVDDDGDDNDDIIQYWQGGTYHRCSSPGHQTGTETSQRRLLTGPKSSDHPRDSTQHPIPQRSFVVSLTAFIGLEKSHKISLLRLPPHLTDFIFYNG